MVLSACVDESVGPMGSWREVFKKSFEMSGFLEFLGFGSWMRDTVKFTEIHRSFELVRLHLTQLKNL